MHIVLIILAVIVGFLWALVVFRTFRIVVVIFALIVVGLIVIGKNIAAQKKATDEAATAAESEGTKLVNENSGHASSHFKSNCAIR
jgi:1,4-dihydroxy-2-naphthoate octaprenyltransferase